MSGALELFSTWLQHAWPWRSTGKPRMRKSFGAPGSFQMWALCTQNEAQITSTWTVCWTLFGSCSSRVCSFFGLCSGLPNKGAGRRGRASSRLRSRSSPGATQRRRRGRRRSRRCSSRNPWRQGHCSNLAQKWRGVLYLSRGPNSLEGVYVGIT